MSINTYTKQQIKNLSLSDNFSAKEFVCSHCGTLKIDTNLIDKLQQLRDILKTPISINSGYRCPIHNKAVGGSSQSFHTKGMAVDFNCYNKLNGSKVLEEVSKIFPRYGFYQSDNSGRCFIHVDTDTSKFVCWLSRRIIVNGRKQNSYQYFNGYNMMLSAMKNDKNVNWFDLII